MLRSACCHTEGAGAFAKQYCGSMEVSQSSPAVVISAAISAAASCTTEKAEAALQPTPCCTSCCLPMAPQTDSSREKASKGHCEYLHRQQRLSLQCATVDVPHGPVHPAGRKVCQWSSLPALDGSDGVTEVTDVTGSKVQDSCVIVTSSAREVLLV